MSELFQQEWFTLYGIPVLIALARIADVSIGTLRIIFVSKGLRLWAPILGFFEVTIWLLAISKVMENLTNPINYIAYAIGFSLGNYIGMYIENRLAIGMVVVRIITKRDSQALVAVLRDLGYSVTVVDADGNTGAVSIVFTLIKRSNIKVITPLILHYNPQAVYSIEDVRHASDPNFPTIITRRSRFSQFIRGVRK
ncbi:DUF2179 domain-containing protein [Sulfurospirillum multivorans]|uniref:UPF0316 protein SMUL_2177 n=2 Tax=Sulfurospirillum multivorans TaxID=66821 RepID=A0AA86AMB2_SULMK|nr:DUF2179 domain-containing protein [Sulfurospirillum multivorans]AHJ13430.1 hypothetical protein SMUL_2177 [Sulfurospirillum multivorans DSM 12446]QEH06921.1 hypothetical protein SMN_2156 [Sulfurospirillum multivorans]